MSWLRLHASPEARTGIRRTKHGVKKGGFLRHLLMPHTILTDKLKGSTGQTGHFGFKTLFGW